MTTYYVGAGGNNANAGTSWAQRKLTLNGAEDIPVAAGDTVYVGAGIYRETLTVDVSGSSGSPITYIGDYDGSHTDGTGGVVRITGSDDDITATRANCITVTSKNYRTYKYFVMDMTTSNNYTQDTACTDTVFDGCYADSIYMNKPTGATKVINSHIIFLHAYASSVINSPDFIVENCIFTGIGYGIQITNVTNFVVKNCTFIGKTEGIRGSLGTNGSGNVMYCYNSIFYRCTTALSLAFTSGNDIVEDYNTFYGCATNRNTVSVGANSIKVPPNFDTRWFFEMLHGGSLVSPFDLASYSALINVAGTSPTTADLRGTAKIGAERELGALEYDSTLDIEAGSGTGGGAVSIQPLSGRISL